MIERDKMSEKEIRDWYVSKHGLESNDDGTKDYFVHKAFLKAWDEKRPLGEWVETSNIWETEDLSGWGYWKECSSCHCQEKRRTAFCPNCGSDNRKSGESE